MANAPEEKREVFICYRSDTRTTFTCHLNAALKRLGIRTCIDIDHSRGDEIPEIFLRAIYEVKLSVIVFPENFATSKWCLDEVVSILECKKTSGQIVLPVFSRIDPSVVRNQIGSYGDAFAKHEQRFEGNMYMVQMWREALKEAADHYGWECSLNRIESDLVEEIAMGVLKKLEPVYVGDLDRLIVKIEKLAVLQGEYSDDQGRHATLEYLRKLNLERGARLLRLPPDVNFSYLHEKQDK